MLISGASSYSAQPASLLPARSTTPGRSAQVSPDTLPKPLSAAPAQTDQRSATAGEAADPSGKEPQDKNSPKQQRLDQLEIAKLSQRDQEVRAHEQAHAAVGGRYAGAPSFTYTSGPDGKRYAIGGEVSIDSGAIANDPQATLNKMQVVIQAALAPAEPSAQDQRVAAQAQATMAQARAELAELRREESQAQGQKVDGETAKEAEETGAEETDAPRGEQQAPPDLDLYRRLSGLPQPSAGVDLQA